MAIMDRGYLKWLSDRMWNNGYHLFADDEKEQEIKRIAFQISKNKDVSIVTRKYKGNKIFLLYSVKNNFPLLPTIFYYSTIDNSESSWLYLSDVISTYKGSWMVK